MEPEPVLESAAENETFPGEVLRTALEMSQDIPKLEQDDRQEDGRTDGRTDYPAIEVASSSELKWEVGAQCQAVWSEDGKVYPGTVVAVDGERCRVRFSDYENEEDMELSALQSPSASPPAPSCQLQKWKPGSQCRAMYSVDGLVYPAVVLWVKGQWCRIRYDKYNNEEELEVSSLLSPDELHGPSRAATGAKVGSLKSASLRSNFDLKRHSREENQRQRGGERRPLWRDDQNSSLMKDEPWNQNKVEKEADEKMKNQQKDSTNIDAPVFPPFPPVPPPQNPFIPIPPLSCAFCGKDAAASLDVNTVTHMLMQWYMCGFYTGSYVTRQQLKSSSIDEVKSPR